MHRPLDPTELEEITAAAEDDLQHLHGARLLITGGTGFIGTWLLESFVHATRRLKLGATAVAISRDPEAFATRAPHLAGAPELRLVRADVRDLRALGTERFDGFVHAATPADAVVAAATPFEMLDTIVDGTRRVLELAERSGDVPFLFTSSGAVYGRQSAAYASETDASGPDPLRGENVYHEGKRVAELLCALAAARGSLRPKIARLFAFVGPHLPLDRHFAIGNFVRDSLLGRTIEVRGDGTTVRSFQYASDLTRWLWRIFVAGRPLHAYNVGSEEALDLASVARRVAAQTCGGSANVRIRGVPVSGAPPHRYVPSTARARGELGLVATVDLDEAIRRTIAWHRG